MIHSIVFVLSTSAARDPVQEIRNCIVPVEPAADEDGRPALMEPLRSWVYSSDELERFGVRSLGDALRLTPGVVVGPGGRVFIHGTPLEDGSVMLDGMRMMGAPRVRP